MRRASIVLAFLLLAGCGQDEASPEDIAGDAAYDAIADSGLESRLEELEAQVVEQESQISDLESSLADAELRDAEIEADIADLDARVPY
jgi:uncharacterized coiled-coil protein SlyX